MRCGFTHWGPPESEGLRGLKRSPWIPSASSSFFSASNRVALGSIFKNSTVIRHGGWKFKQGTSLTLRPWKGLPWQHNAKVSQATWSQLFSSRDGRLSMHFFWLSAILGVRQSNETCPAYICILYILECPPPPPRQPKGEKNRSNLRDSVMPLLCRELDGGFNSVEKYYFPKVCCENPESSKPPTREKTTQRIYKLMVFPDVAARNLQVPLLFPWELLELCPSRIPPREHLTPERWFVALKKLFGTHKGFHTVFNLLLKKPYRDSW